MGTQNKHQKVRGKRPLRREAAKARLIETIEAGTFTLADFRRMRQENLKAACGCRSRETALGALEELEHQLSRR
jgi:hypothetical protein